MKDGLDIVSIRIQDERAKVAGMIRPFARRAIIPTARRKRCQMKALHRFAIGRLKSEMNPGDIAIGFVHEQLIGVKEAWPLLQCILVPQRREHRAIEVLLASRSATRRWIWSKSLPR